jgi:hypothetical protein
MFNYYWILIQRFIAIHPFGAVLFCIVFLLFVAVFIRGVQEVILRKRELAILPESILIVPEDETPDYFSDTKWKARLKKEQKLVDKVQKVTITEMPVVADISVSEDCFESRVCEIHNIGRIKMPDLPTMPEVPRI